LHPQPVDPAGHLVGVEADVLAEFHEGDPPFGYEPTDVDHLDAQPAGEALGVE
jgi:hypothetical protein